MANATRNQSNETRHGKRAAGTTVVSFPCSQALKAEIAKLAQADSRTVAAWLRLKLQDTIRRSRARRNA